MIQIDDQQTLYPLLGEWLVAQGQRLLVALELPSAEVSLVLCDDPTIRELNREWRKLDKATDVLSFPQEEGEEFPVVMGEEEESPPQFLGDIVISVETCASQAEEWGHSLEEEAIRLWIHGFLHLCGYDHLTEEETLEMRQREQELLAMLGASSVEPLARL